MAKEKKILAVVDGDMLSEKDFLDAFKKVMDFVKEKESKMTKEIQDSFSLVTKHFNDLKEKIENQLEKTTEKLSKSEEDFLKQCESRMGEMESEIRGKLSEVQDGKDADEQAMIATMIPKITESVTKEVQQPIVDTIESDLPQLGKATRDGLELLEGDERLDKSAVKGLEEMEKSIRASIPGRIQTPAKAFRVYLADLTSQCNGSATTFNVGGSHFGIIGVYGTEFPMIYRPTIDYTETRNGFTLTGAVTPPATGQTLICQYLK